MSRGLPAEKQADEFQKDVALGSTIRIRARSSDLDLKWFSRHLLALSEGENVSIRLDSRKRQILEHLRDTGKYPDAHRTIYFELLSYSDELSQLLAQCQYYVTEPDGFTQPP